MLLVAATACTGSTADPEPTDTSVAPPVSTTDTETPTPTADPSPEPDPEAEIRALWEEAHRRRLEVTYSDRPTNAAMFDDVADEATAEVLALFAAAGRPAVASSVQTIVQGTDVAVDVATATIRACVMAGVGPASGGGATALTPTLWEGQARRLPVGWRVTEAELGVGDCVPDEFADAIVSAYADWVRTYREWWDPPNPDDSRIGDLMGEPALTAMRDLLTEHADMGIAVRDDHEPNEAVVSDLQGDVVTISDCYAAADGRAAAYDLESGELREDLTPVPEAGQFDALLAEFRWERSGEWTVVGWSSRVDVGCRPGETDYAVIP